MAAAFAHAALGDIDDKVQQQAVLKDRDNNDAEKRAAKAATAAALLDFLRAISTAPKEELTGDVRASIDEALVRHASDLKWPLVNALRSCAAHRALLGLPRVLEETRRHLTTASATKVQSVVEELGQDIERCKDKKTLEWVEAVMAYMTGAGKFKKELGGFDLKGDAKNRVRASVNRARRARELLEKKNAPPPKVSTNLKTSNGPASFGFGARDIRIEEAEREAARTNAMASMIDEALLTAKKTKKK